MIEEEFEDTKRVIWIRKSKKNRQHNGQKKKDTRTNNDLQNITHKTKDRVTRTPLKTGVPAPLVAPVFYTFCFERKLIGYYTSQYWRSECDKFRLYPNGEQLKENKKHTGWIYAIISKLDIYVFPLLAQ